MSSPNDDAPMLLGLFVCFVITACLIMWFYFAKDNAATLAAEATNAATLAAEATNAATLAAEATNAATLAAEANAVINDSESDSESDTDSETDSETDSDTEVVDPYVEVNATSTWSTYNEPIVVDGIYKITHVDRNRVLVGHFESGTNTHVNYGSADIMVENPGQSIGYIKIEKNQDYHNFKVNLPNPENNLHLDFVLSDLVQIPDTDDDPKYYHQCIKHNNSRGSLQSANFEMVPTTSGDGYKIKVKDGTSGDWLWCNANGDHLFAKKELSEATEFYLSKLAADTAADTADTAVLNDFNGSITSWKGGQGKYCAVDGVDIKCNLDDVGDEKYIIEVLPNNKFALKSQRLDKYCGDVGDKIICNTPTIGDWEKFHGEILSIDDNELTVNLKSGQNTTKWCTDETNKIKCDSDEAGALEKHTFTKV